MKWREIEEAAEWSAAGVQFVHRERRAGKELWSDYFSSLREELEMAQIVVGHLMWHNPDARYAVNAQSKRPSPISKDFLSGLRADD